MNCAGDRQREAEQPGEPAEPQPGDHLGDDHAGGGQAGLGHRRRRGEDDRQQQDGDAERQADPHHGWHGRLAEAGQQRHGGAEAGQHQHEGEAPGRQVRQRCGGVGGHEPPTAIIRSNSISV